MTGPKLNERSFVAGERTGIRASVRGARFSASKARVVLDLIRGLDVVSADQVLQFTEREAARAADLIRTVPGVVRVVRVFEMMTEDELANLK